MPARRASVPAAGERLDAAGILAISIGRPRARRPGQTETMQSEAPHQDRSPSPDMVECGLDGAREPTPVLFRPEPHLRSPLIEHRVTGIRARDAAPEAPAWALPSARALVRPAAWAIVLAAPMLVLIGWQMAALMGTLAAVMRELDVRLRRANITFAEGFLPFRGGAPWPHGVQEEDEIRWNWSRRAGQGRPSRI